MKESFGSFLKAKRTGKNMTQKELAALLFVSESAVSKWEKDVARPDISLLPKLSEILDVTEHELITASVDRLKRVEKEQARKWRNLSLTMTLFFYISYGVALLTCFICNVAVNKTLSWFWIVLAALNLAFSFTSLPQLIKKHKLILIPLSMYCSLCVLLLVCAIYTQGTWFFIAALSVLLGLSPIFTPIYIAKLEFFKKFRKYNDFVSLGVVFIILTILLFVIYIHTLIFSSVTPWFFTIALPIVFCVYVILNLLCSVRFLKTNRFTKTGIILFLSDLFVYLIPPFIRVKNPSFQRELDDFNVFLSNLSSWNVYTIEQNIHLIIFLTVLALAIVFTSVGLIVHNRKKGEKT